MTFYVENESGKELPFSTDELISDVIKKVLEKRKMSLRNPVTPRPCRQRDRHRLASPHLKPAQPTTGTVRRHRSPAAVGDSSAAVIALAAAAGRHAAKLLTVAHVVHDLRPPIEALAPTAIARPILPDPLVCRSLNRPSRSSRAPATPNGYYH